MSMKPTYEELQKQLTESRREFTAANATIHNLELKVAQVVAENAALKLVDTWMNADQVGGEAADKAIENGASPGEATRAGIQAVIDSIKTPETDAYLAEVRAQAIADYSSKRGFSFQHGSIHAHFGNGDVMVGATKFENGHAGICFAPVREKDGGVGTEYKWTEGKNTEEVNAVFVISSSSAEGLEVIQNKLAEAIESFAAQLRQGAEHE